MPDQTAIGGEIQPMPQRVVTAYQRRTKLVPFKQGGIDGLCGLYAVFNACAYLFPGLLEPYEENADTLGHKLADALTDSEFKDAWLNGTELPIVERWVAAAEQFLSGQGRQSERVEAHCSEAQTVDEYWDCLEHLIGTRKDERCVAVVGFGDPDPHWTCVVGVTDKAIELFDSSMYTSEKRAKTTLPKDARDDLWVVEPESTVVLSRLGHRLVADAEAAQRWTAFA